MPVQPPLFGGLSRPYPLDGASIRGVAETGPLDLAVGWAFQLNLVDKQATSPPAARMDAD
jgi:hypothetical protein